MEKSFIPKGMKITGNVDAEGDLILCGEVDGSVKVDGTLELSGSLHGDSLKVGRIELKDCCVETNINCDDHVFIDSNVTIAGDVQAKSAEINGALKGCLDVEDNVIVGSSGVVIGKVSAKDLQIDMGAVCDIVIDRSHADSRPADFFEKYEREHPTIA